MASMKIDTGLTHKVKQAVESIGLPPSTTTKALWGKKPLRHQAPIRTYPSLIGTKIPTTPEVRTQRYVGDKLSPDFHWDLQPPKYNGKFSVSNEKARIDNIERLKYLPLRPGMDKIRETMTFPNRDVTKSGAQPVSCGEWVSGLNLTPTTHEEITLSVGGEITKALNKELDLLAVKS